MRKIFAILMICAMLLLSACQQNEVPLSTDPPVSSTVSTVYQEETSELDSTSTTETTLVPESTAASSQPVITNPPENEKKPVEQTQPTETKPVVPEESKAQETTSTETKPQVSTDTGKENEPVPTDPVPEETVPTTTKPPVVEEVKPTTPPTESVELEETKPTEPVFDINYWIDYAKSYAQSKGLVLSEAAIDCWDNPIGAGAHCIYLERDIQSRLNRYAKDEDITDVWIWAEATGNGRYDLYIGYA